ncbi:3-deoxy-7-phosphoheptulonate synthase [bacterium CG17_big_fil_post_rev_8_21_14_2_50_64_8]|nr:MAG: 3-deoxy-7-phosphoheptulonate synthase [bacterium CG17_big_fil_post_rev_8_21_14_2_50_64_8]
MKIPAAAPLTLRREGQETSLVRVGDVVFGGPTVVLIGGPCAVEDRQQILDTARYVAEAGGRMLRGGAWKPRTSPYSFQGLGEEGLPLLVAAREVTGLPVVTEVLDPRDVELVAGTADMLQIGSRNIQNFPLLKEAGASGTPVLLKRGMMTTVDEWLLSAEHVLNAGGRDVVLCERGIRTFDPALRNTLDVGGVALLKTLTHLPVIVDPSHAAGDRRLVCALARAAVAAGADGLLVETHPDPSSARSDGQQSLDPDEFRELAVYCRAVARALGRDL